MVSDLEGGALHSAFTFTTYLPYCTFIPTKNDTINDAYAVPDADPSYEVPA